MKNKSDFFFILVNLCLYQLIFGLHCNKLISGRNVTFCCNNSEKTDDGQCRECDTGFISIDGEPCKPCLNGWYGSKCINRCLCEETERCSNVNGLCTVYLPAQDSTILPDINDGSFSTDAGISHYESAKELLDPCDDVLRLLTWIHVRRRAFLLSPQCGDTTFCIIHLALDKIQKREIITYSISIGSFLLLCVLITLIVCFMKDNTRFKLFTIAQNGSGRVRNDNAIHSPESFYDSIDEADIEDIGPNGFVNGKQGSSDDSVRHIIFDYESPTGSHASFNGKDTQAVTKSSSSSESSRDGKCFGYLNPYQLAVQTHDKCHDYEKCSGVQYLELLDVSTLKKPNLLYNGQSKFNDENSSYRKEERIVSTNKLTVHRQYRSDFCLNNAKQNFEQSSTRIIISSSY